MQTCHVRLAARITCTDVLSDLRAVIPWAAAAPTAFALTDLRLLLPVAPRFQFPISFLIGSRTQSATAGASPMAIYYRIL